MLGRNQQQTAPESPAENSLADYYLSLLERVYQKVNASPRKTVIVGISSCQSGEGVTTVAANLAHVAGLQRHRPVLLVDANLTNPQLDTMLGASASPGLAEAVAGTAELANCLRRRPEGGITILPAGSAALREQTNLHSSQVAPLLQNLRQQFGLIIFDLPPTTARSNTLGIAPVLDGVLLVVEAERTRSPVINRAKQQLEDAGASLLGIVLNRRREHVPSWLYHRL